MWNWLHIQFILSILWNKILFSKTLQYTCQSSEAVSVSCNFLDQKLIYVLFFRQITIWIWQKVRLFPFPVVFVDRKLISHSCCPQDTVSKLLNSKLQFRKVPCPLTTHHRLFLAPIHNDAIDLEINQKSETIRADRNRKLFHYYTPLLSRCFVILGTVHL